VPVASMKCSSRRNCDLGSPIDDEVRAQPQ